MYLYKIWANAIWRLAQPTVTTKSWIMSKKIADGRGYWSPAHTV